MLCVGVSVTDAEASLFGKAEGILICVFLFFFSLGFKCEASLFGKADGILICVFVVLFSWIIYMKRLCSVSICEASLLGKEAGILSYVFLFIFSLFFSIHASIYIIE